MGPMSLYVGLFFYVQLIVENKVSTDHDTNTLDEISDIMVPAINHPYIF